MKKYLLYTLSIAILSLLTGCQTNQLRQFGKLQNGMDKGQVVEVMGSPQDSYRWKGEDLWTYRFFEKEISYQKQVRFQDGKVIFFGEPQPGSPTPAEIDAANAASNAEAEAQLVQRKKSLQEDTRKYEEEHSGPNNSGTVPQFKPID